MRTCVLKGVSSVGEVASLCKLKLIVYRNELKLTSGINCGTYFCHLLNWLCYHWNGHFKTETSHTKQFKDSVPPDTNIKTRKTLAANKYSNIPFLISISIFNSSLGNVLAVSLHASNPLASSSPCSVFYLHRTKCQAADRERGQHTGVCTKEQSWKGILWQQTLTWGSILHTTAWQVRAH